MLYIAKIVLLQTSVKREKRTEKRKKSSPLENRQIQFCFVENKKIKNSFHQRKLNKTIQDNFVKMRKEIQDEIKTIPKGYDFAKKKKIDNEKV